MHWIVSNQIWGRETELMPGTKEYRTGCIADLQRVWPELFGLRLEVRAIGGVALVCGVASDA